MFFQWRWQSHADVGSFDAAPSLTVVSEFQIRVISVAGGDVPSRNRLQIREVEPIRGPQRSWTTPDSGFPHLPDDPQAGGTDSRYCLAFARQLLVVRIFWNVV